MEEREVFDQMLTRFQQNQWKVLMELFAVGKSSIEVQSKPLGKVAPDSALVSNNLDVYA